MRLVYIITQGECGGAQKNVLDTAIAIQKAGNEVFVVTGEQKRKEDKWLFEELLKNNFQSSHLIEIKTLQREINIFKDIKALMRLFSIIKKIKPDIVHLHSSKAGFLGSIAGKMAKTKIIYTIHGFVFTEPLPIIKKIIYILAEYFASFFQDRTITVSLFDEKIGARFHITKKEKNSVIYNGIDADLQSNILAKEQARIFLEKLLNKKIEPGFVVGTIANLYKTKGIEYLIETAVKLKDRNIIFIVMGEGELRGELEKVIKENELSKNFFLVGAVPEAYRYLQAFDLVVMPSLKEGFPYVVLESLLAGVPILATSVGGIPEIADKAKIEMVEPADSEALVQKIKLKMDSKNQEAFSANPPPFPEIFTKKYMIEKILKEYSLLLGK